MKTEKLDRLLSLVCHDAHCDMYQGIVYPPKCTCGLDAARAELNKIKKELLNLKVENSAWSATFQKYQSWKANGIKGKVIDSVVSDYEKLKKSFDQSRGQQ